MLFRTDAAYPPAPLALGGGDKAAAITGIALLDMSWCAAICSQLAAPRCSVSFHFACGQSTNVSCQSTDNRDGHPPPPTHIHTHVRTASASTAACPLLVFVCAAF
eukprot:366573-Chlamydomonas_euryale.AAC.46